MPSVRRSRSRSRFLGAAAVLLSALLLLTLAARASAAPLLLLPTTFFATSGNATSLAEVLLLNGLQSKIDLLSSLTGFFAPIGNVSSSLVR